MGDLEDIGASGKKNKLQFPRRLRQQIEDECGLTNEEREILRCRANGMGVIETSFHMQEVTGQYYPDRKVERRIRSIKNKIAAVAKELRETG